MRNPFLRASGKLASIGRCFLQPNQADELDRGPFQLGGNQSRPAIEELTGLGTITQGETQTPIAFSITGNLQPTLQLNTGNTPNSSITLKLVWGEPLNIEPWLSTSGNHASIVPTEPLQAGLYELSVHTTRLHFLLYDPAFPHVPLQIDPQPDVTTHAEGVTRSPDLLGIIFNQDPSDAAMSALCRSIPIKPVSYAKNLRHLMGQKLSASEDSFALREAIAQSPLVHKAFIPGERTLSGGERPGITLAVAIDRPDFEIPSNQEGPSPLLA